MAIQTIEYDELVDPTSIILPQDVVSGQWLAIDITVLARDKNIGKADLTKTIPRIYSGYWYLTKNNSVVQHGTIEFERQRVYEQQLFRIQDALQRGLSFRYDKFNALDGDANPFDFPTGLFAQGDLAFMSGLSELDPCNRIPSHPIGTLVVWIPTGVMYKVKIQYEDWCSLITDNDEDGNPELSETSGYLQPEDINAPLSMNGEFQATFDEIARAKGYILASECETLSTPQVRFYYEPQCFSDPAYLVLDLDSGTVLPIASYTVDYANYSVSCGGSGGRLGTLNYTDNNGTVRSLTLANNSTANFVASDFTFGYNLTP